MDIPETSSFGDMLKRFRRHKKLTQQQLAKLVGASRNAISFWERGEYLPEALATVLELARVLNLNEEEQRLLVEARFGTASILPMYNFPEHNPYFTGREETLRSLHAQLTAGKHIALIQTQAISGLGGIGKTQVAIEYAYRFREHYHDILWVAADSRETLMTSYLTLAQYLHLREREEREQSKVIKAVKHWFHEHKGWLLILDNIEDFELVREFVPTLRQGAVILTTRRAETRPLAQPLLLDIMSEEEGVLLLIRRSGYLALEAVVEAVSARDREVAKAIVHAVGGLPLALDQAGAYITETNCSMSDYLALFKQRQTALLQRRGTVPSDHPQSVTTTFSLTFEQIQLKDESVVELLKLCAYLAPDAIPLEVITEGAAHLGKVLKTMAVDVLQLNQALETLQAYSLVQHDGGKSTLSIHRLVQAVFQDKMEEAERHSWVERATRAVNAAFPHAEHSSWQQCERLLPQVLTITQLIEQYQVIVEEAGRLLHETATYLRDRARYAEAEPLYKYAQRILEQQLGPRHPNVAYPLNGLAILYREQGKYTEAESLYQRAQHIWEQQLGPWHPNVAYPLTGLANLYSEQGKYTEAEPLYQRALRIWEQQLEPQHPDIASPLTGLANLYREQGKYTEAEALYQRALHIREQELGPQHPETAETMHDLARLQEAQNNGKEAITWYTRVLTIREQELGAQHPKTRGTRTHFIALLHVLGQHEQAAQLEMNQAELRAMQDERKIHPEE